MNVIPATDRWHHIKGTCRVFHLFGIFFTTFFQWYVFSCDTVLWFHPALPLCTGFTHYRLTVNQGSGVKCLFCGSSEMCYTYICPPSRLGIFVKFGKMVIFSIAGRFKWQTPGNCSKGPGGILPQVGNFIKKWTSRLCDPLQLFTLNIKVQWQVVG